MSRQPVLKNFVSEIDQFLQKFDQQHTTPSLSQEKERAKYKRIYRLRDNSSCPATPPKLWEGF